MTLACGIAFYIATLVIGYTRLHDSAGEQLPVLSVGSDKNHLSPLAVWQ